MRDWLFWDWMAYGALAIGALILALEAGLRNAPKLAAKMPRFVTGPVWPFLPLLFVFIGSTLLLFRALGVLGVPPAVGEPEPQKRIASGPKVFVSAAITPEYLMSSFEDRTKIQALALVSPYVGKWIKVSGRVFQVGKSEGSQFVLLSFQPENTQTTDWRSSATTYMYFRLTWLDRLSMLKVGERIIVVGRIDRVGSRELILDDCEVAEN